MVSVDASVVLVTAGVVRLAVTLLKLLRMSTFPPPNPLHLSTCLEAGGIK